VQIEHHLNAKEKTLNLILELQNRAKWYRAINDKKYRLALKDTEETAKTEIIILQTQNKNLKEMLRYTKQNPVHEAAKTVLCLCT
jgi:hypothetical protein